MQRKNLVHVAALVALTFVLGACAHSQAGSSAGKSAAPISYPEGYRSWFHVKSRINLDGHSAAANVAFQHIYANDKALAGLKSGQYADGAVLVMDRIGYAEAADKVLNEGARKALLVMIKDAARYPATGGWGFEGFKGGDPAQRLVSDGGAKCFTCHAPLSQDGFVFSKWRG